MYEIAIFLIGWEGEKIRELQKELDKKLYLYINEYQLPKKYQIQFSTIEKMEEEFKYLKEGDELELEIYDTYMLNFQDGITWSKGHMIQVTGGGNLKGKKVRIRINKVYPYFSKAVLS